MNGLFQVPFFDDEVATSWVSRLARANGRRSSYIFCSDLGLSFVSVGRGDEEELTKLARISGHPLSNLSSKAMRLRENGSTYFAGETYPARMLRKSKPCFCPLCLQEDDRNPTRMPGTRRYERVGWLLTAIQTCQTHKCALLSLPSAHGYEALDYYSRLDAVRVFDQAVETREASAFERFLYDRLSDRRCHGSLLDRLSVATCIDLSFLFGVVASFGRDRSYRGLDETSRRVAANSGFSILLSGEQGIVDLLDSLAATRKTRGEFGGAQFYGTLYDRLSKSYAGAEFDYVREILRQHAKANIPMPNGTRLFGQAMETPWMTVTEVARQSGVAPSVIRKLLREEGRLPPKGHLVRQEAAAALAQTLNGALTNDQAAALLEVPRGVFPRFVQAGLITACAPTMMSRHPAGGVKTRFPGEEIRKLRTRLIDASTSPFRDGMISAREASRLSKVPLTTIARLLLEGKLVASHAENEASLFERIHIDQNELLRAVNYVSGLSTQMAAARIGVSKVAMSRLRDKQVIRARHITGVRHEAYIFTEGDLRAFEEQYISLGRLSGELGVHRNRIRQRMRELGMSSAFPRREVECHLLRRRDIDRLREAL